MYVSKAYLFWQPVSGGMEPLWVVSPGHGGRGAFVAGMRGARAHSSAMWSALLQVGHGAAGASA